VTIIAAKILGQNIENSANLLFPVIPNIIDQGS
jgi:hypothetical protein